MASSAGLSPLAPRTLAGGTEVMGTGRDAGLAAGVAENDGAGICCARAGGAEVEGTASIGLSLLASAGIWTMT